jgi:hypothetical protein
MAGAARVVWGLKGILFDVRWRGHNLDATVVGYYSDANFLFHAFVRTADGKVVTFVGPNSCDSNGNAGCYGTGALDINILQTSVTRT